MPPSSQPFPLPYEDFAHSVWRWETPLPVERNFDHRAAFDWMKRHWTFSVWLSAAYIVFIFVGQRLMKHREPFELRPLLATWSFGLAVFSIVGTVRVLPPIAYLLYHEGVDYMTCKPPVYFGDTGYWGWIFTLSKALELGDTVFIILRKKPLLFLHWYHHVTVLIYSCYTYADYYSPGQWSVPMNVVVHSLMYSYYFLAAMKIRLPRKVNICITTVQLSQMIIGVLVNIRGVMLLSRGESCQLKYDHLGYSLGMYGSYALLFAHYFYKAYLAPKKSKPMQNGKVQMNGHSNIANGVNNNYVQNGRDNGHIKTH